MSLDLGRHDRAIEVQGPRAYEVRTGTRYLRALEDGEIACWQEYHLFIIDERTGSVMIEGGYGTFSYGWPSVARGPEPLHSFLYDLHFDYFMGKAAKQPHRIVDHDRTVSELKRQLMKTRWEDGRWRGTDWGKARVREMWDDLVSWECGYQGESLVQKLFEDSNWYQFLDCSDPSYMQDHPCMRRFWDEVWSVFREQVLKPHWLSHLAKTPLPRRRALISTHGRFDRIAA